jgi:hypothetical protein
VNLIAISFDRPDLYHLALIHVLAGSGWVPGGIVVEHPGGRLDRSFSEPIQVHCTDNVALKVDSNAAGAAWLADDGRATGQLAA